VKEFEGFRIAAELLHLPVEPAGAEERGKHVTF
jgi:hypothetical protein